MINNNTFKNLIDIGDIVYTVYEDPICEILSVHEHEILKKEENTFTIAMFNSRKFSIPYNMLNEFVFLNKEDAYIALQKGMIKWQNYQTKQPSEK